MRLLHVIRTLDPHYGGPVEGLQNISQVLRSLGHQVEIVCMDSPNAKWLEKWDCQAIHAIGSSRTLFAYSCALDKWLRENVHSFDALIINGVWMYYSQAARRAARRAAIPYFVFTHGMLDPWFAHAYPLKHVKKTIYWKLFENKVIRDAEATLFTSSTEQSLAGLSFAPYSCKAQVVGYGILTPPDSQEPTATSKSEIAKAFPSIRNRPFLLFLARLHRKKGVDLLLKAYASTRHLSPTTALVIAGSGDDWLSSSLKELSNSLGVKDDVVWTGMIQGENKWRLLRCADAYILPSHQENFGVSVAESLACGTPVLISDKVNIWQQIVEDGAGLAANDDLPGTISLLKSWYATSADDRGRMAHAASRCFLDNFELKANCWKLAELIKAAVLLNRSSNDLVNCD